MPLIPAALEDLTSVAALVNSAYRGETSRQGWTTEADLLGGQRTDPETLAQQLGANPDARLLVLRDEAAGPPLGVVWLEPTSEPDVWHLGMLTVRPDLQDRKLGRSLLEGAEATAAGLGAERIRMTVIPLRAELVAWYERRGYRRTGETKPFPYGDLRFGEPRRDDLEFIVLEKALSSARARR